MAKAILFGILFLIVLSMSVFAAAPVFDTITVPPAREGQLLTIQVSVTDADGNTANLGMTTSPASSTFIDNRNNSGTFTWTPNYNDSGMVTLTFTADDQTNSTIVTQSVSFMVENTNRAPVLAAIGNKQVTVGQILTFTVSATDEDNDQLTYVASGLPSGASLATFSNRVFNWTPAASQVGSHQVAFTVSDQQSQDSETMTDSETITITVLAAPSSQSSEEQRYQDLVDDFDQLEDDYFEAKRDYERAIERDDDGDARDAEEQLDDIYDDLDNLRDDIDDLTNDVEDNRNVSNRRELLDDLEELDDDAVRLQERIDDVLGKDDDTQSSANQAAYEASQRQQPPSAATSERTRVVVEKLDYTGSSAEPVDSIEPQATSWEKIRTYAWISAGIVILVALIVFLLALLL